MMQDERGTAVVAELQADEERPPMAKHQSWDYDGRRPQVASKAYGVFEKELRVRRGMNDIVWASASRVATQFPRLLIARIFKHAAAV
jgi:hypothetical protein